MKKRALTLFLLFLTLTGCKNAPESRELSRQTEENFMYNFKPCSPDLLPDVRSKICNLYEDKPAEYHSLFIGQALSRFGESDYTTENNEDLFSKAVSAEDKDGNVLYFEVYYGPSGPAVGGDALSEESRKAADELAKYIMSAEPKDFEYKSVYEDLGVTIRMGVENGKPYYLSDIPDGLF